MLLQAALPVYRASRSTGRLAGRYILPFPRLGRQRLRDRPDAARERRRPVP